MTNTKTPIRKTIIKDYRGERVEICVYAEANGLILGHCVGHKDWEVTHRKTGTVIRCRSPKWNPKAKTKVAKFFDYLVAAPFPWAEWEEQGVRPSWADDAYAYVRAWANDESAPAFSQSNF